MVLFVKSQLTALNVAYVAERCLCGFTLSPIGPTTSIFIIPTVLTPCLTFSCARSADGSRFLFSFHAHDTIVQCPSTIPRPHHPPSSPFVAPSPISLPRCLTTAPSTPLSLRRLRPPPLPPPPPPTFSIYPVHTVLKGLTTELSKATETLAVYNNSNKILVLVNYKYMKMKRVSLVVPFGVCFSSRIVGKTVTGPNVPTIDLVLRGGVELRIYGVNSMVKVNKKV